VRCARRCYSQASVPSPVEAYLTRLRRRAALMHAARAAIAACGATAVAFAVFAVAIGPLGEPAIAWIAWIAVFAAAAAVAAWAWWTFRPWRGTGVARLLRDAAPELPSAARSAFELARTPSFSPAMVQAHQQRVVRALEAIPPKSIVRWAWLQHRSVALGAAGIAIAAFALTTERGNAGAYALVHPGVRAEDGARLAVVFSSVTAHLVYPSYLDRAPTTIPDPTLLEVPHGTSIEVTANARIDADRAALRVAGRPIPMERTGQGRFVGRFVAREDGPLVLRLRSPGGDWVNDAVERRVHVIADEAPRVSLSDPAIDQVLEEPRSLPIIWEASDDVGLARVDLVVRTPDGQQSRRRLATYEEPLWPPISGGTAPLDLASFNLARGDTVTLWLEAFDGDVVSGPNVGRSSEISITIATLAALRDRDLGALEDVLAQGIQLLADRLERPAPTSDDAARLRFSALEDATGDFAVALHDHADALSRTSARSSDLAIYREMAARVRRLTHEERLAHGSRIAAIEERQAIDARATAELERDVLTLDDMLGRARVEDAAQIARELEALRREMTSLLAELRRTSSPEARERLMAAIANAQARLRELYARIAEMGTQVPQEFMNAGEAGAMQESADALEQLRQALERGDLDAADRQLSALQRQIDQLARSLGQTEEGFVEERFGPRERAFAEAMDALVGLEAEQGQLARRGVERRSRAARRALEAVGGTDNRAGRRLAEETQRVREALEALDREHLAEFEQETYDRVRQRLIDTEDALSTGDLGEAQSMAEAAADDLAGLSRDLDLSALMFPGHEGQTRADSERARAANHALRGLRREIAGALPDVSAHLEASDRTEMRGDHGRQGEARAAAEALAEQFDRGNEGVALDDRAAGELHDAAAAMERAADALNRGDALESAQHEEDAARRLTELRERLEQDSQQGGGSSGEEGSGMPQGGAVQIPDADQFEGPMEMRRRLLDAMREGAPRGYEEAVRRYYEGLLR
jgi:hypothetical protein